MAFDTISSSVLHRLSANVCDSAIQIFRELVCAGKPADLRSDEEILSMNFTSGTVERFQVRPLSDVFANPLAVPSNSLPTPIRGLMNRTR
jgi:hypothetical protein